MSVTELFPTHESKLLAIDSAVRRRETGAVHRLRAADAVHGSTRANPAELRRILAATELRLAAAMRQLDRMRHRDAARERKAVSLKAAVVSAQRFAYHDERTGLPNRQCPKVSFTCLKPSKARNSNVGSNESGNP